MALDIFSRFDDHNKVIFGWFYFLWFVVLVVVLWFSNKFWMLNRSNFRVVSSIIRLVGGLYGRTRSKFIGGMARLFVGLFLALVIINLLGLVPFVFSLTRHLAVNGVLALVVWLRVVLIGLVYNLPAFLAHLQPIGSPRLLNPFLCLIELVSLLVRPLTLAVRLTANLRTGHILIALLGSGFISVPGLGRLFVLVLGVFYFLFEMGVCVIQGYIFTLLPTLYADEHPYAS